MEALLTSKSEYMLQPSLDGLHKQTIEWMSDCEFCKAELSFLNKRLNKQLLQLKSSRDLTRLMELEKKMQDFKSIYLKDIVAEIKEHEKHLALLEENAFAQNEQRYREEHVKYALSVDGFMKSLKKIKKEVFTFIEFQIEASHPKPKKIKVVKH